MGLCLLDRGASRARCWWIKRILMKSMHSFGRYCTAAFVLLASIHVCAQADLKVGTTSAAEQATTVVEPTVRSAVAARYEVLLEQEQLVSQSPAATADDFRVVI